MIRVAVRFTESCIHGINWGSILCSFEVIWEVVPIGTEDVEASH